ncbi:unnamed protein product [marine sediment metagenome]|uniref:protein-L-isoaspartate(D-aspartate) O-methyltransferase n=1 Tax=marine sediment metagenome TaxID=412755 RepID=X1LPK6_9ZZZZ
MHGKLNSVRFLLFNVLKSVLIILMALFILSDCKRELKENRETTERKETFFDHAREEMVKAQIRNRGIKDERLLKAMLKVERHKFVPEKIQKFAYIDRPLPIGEGQTISQPYIVALMTELLKAQRKPWAKVCIRTL